ncbi:Rec8 like protein-domain-containing protein [Thelephora terrestris]|uniref:Rec8 like protein-domain-containing protein n=1 Tax=Thelephora terrestris TaxID=56493 RepID=A0A9P6L8N7_9AGAM|nr:Rec8 like protein-domain-containing protein [Thelephora terrestris]
MFFTPELLSRRDSGFGLLWLAATLGSKSSFKKLPKRSVLTADISQLCDLIAEPKEPLALRLSSNLMVGVARVYQVKHEIFLVDVTACFNSLRKTFQDLALTNNEAALQMNQPTMRPEALNLPNDPARNMAFDFATRFADWEDIGRDDGEYDPNARTKTQKKKRVVSETMPPPSSEIGRQNLYTLPEDHGHIFSNSMDLSFSGDAGPVALSSQVDIYGFEDNLFGPPEAVADGPDISEELAQVLGDDWGADQTIEMGEELQTQMTNGPLMDLDIGDDLQYVDPAAVERPEPSMPPGERLLSDSDKENRIPPDTIPLEGTQGCFIAESFPRTTPMEDVQPSPKPQKTRNRRKRDGNFLDGQTELTSEELKEIRETYLQRQHILRSEVEAKRREREAAVVFDQLLWAVPHDMIAPEIVDFWRENLRAQFNARSGIRDSVVEKSPGPPRKRRRTRPSPPTVDQETLPQVDDVDLGANVDTDYHFQREAESARLRSSEEPGQARHASRPPSIVGSHLGIVARGNQDSVVQSQKSSLLFPWDNAGVSSSGGFDFDLGHGSLNLGSGTGEMPLHRSRSVSGREGSLMRSLAGSPVPFNLQNEGPLSDDFQFRVPDEDTSVASLRPDVNLRNLEPKSHDFLKYAKMLLQTLPGTGALRFDDVAPKAPKVSGTETRRVAAAAFYHCLVLSTKDLVKLEQKEPYGRIEITIK